MLPESIDFLFNAGRQAASADNSQPWHFFWNGEGIEISYDLGRVRNKTFPPDYPATILGIGSAIENIDQATSATGIDISWKSLPNSLDQKVYVQGFVSGEIERPVTKRGQLPLFDRHTNRFAYLNDPLPDDMKIIVNSSLEGNARAQLVEDRKLIQEIGNLGYSCSEVRFQTKEVHEWLGRCLRFTSAEVARGDGLDVATIPLPPGGTLFLKLIKEWKRMSFLNKLGAYKLMAGIDASPIQNAPALIAITGECSKSATIDAGRLMTRLWIQLNTKGIAAQPFYVIADQLTRLKEGSIPTKLIEKIGKVEEKCTKLFELTEDERLHMILRVGFPKSNPTRSRRIPLDFLYTDLTKK